MISAQRSRSRFSRIALRCLQVMAGLVAGLLVSELGLRVVNHGTSSQLALYQPESVLGYSMKPNQVQPWIPYPNRFRHQFCGLLMDRKLHGDWTDQAAMEPVIQESSPATPEVIDQQTEKKDHIFQMLKSKSRIVFRLFQVAAGLVIGLLLVELGLQIKNQRAFPYIPMYETDSSLGYAMIPNRTYRWLAFPHHVVSIQTNTEGFRGRDWPTIPQKSFFGANTDAARPALDIMVGDSHVFGYGINEEDTLSEQLSNVLGKPVLNMGVNSYGPLEYNKLVRKNIRYLQPQIIWYVIDLDSDPQDVLFPPSQRLHTPSGYLQSTPAPPQGLYRLFFHPSLQQSQLAYFFRFSSLTRPIDRTKKTTSDQPKLAAKNTKENDFDYEKNEKIRIVESMRQSFMAAQTSIFAVDNHVRKTESVWLFFSEKIRDVAREIRKAEFLTVDIFSCGCACAGMSYPPTSYDEFFERRDRTSYSPIPLRWKRTSSPNVEQPFVRFITEELVRMKPSDPRKPLFENYLALIEKRDRAIKNYQRDLAAYEKRVFPKRKPYFFEPELQAVHDLAETHQAKLFLVVLDTKQERAKVATSNAEQMLFTIEKVGKKLKIPYVVITPEQLDKGTDYVPDGIHLNKNGVRKVITKITPATTKATQ
jgi:hypothetical protein